MIQCKKCNLEWQPRLIHPKVCPNCKSYDWMNPKKVRGQHNQERVTTRPEVETAAIDTNTIGTE